MLERLGIRWWQSPLLDDGGRLLAVISARHGGVSEGGFESLNLSWTVGDDPRRVDENRHRFFAAIGVEPRAVSYVRQIHGAHVVEPSPETLVDQSGGPVVEADAQMTDRPGIALFLTFADCVPLLMYDPRRLAIGLAHAGWRGTVTGVGHRLVDGMRARYGCQPGDLRVALGPSIGPCCYAVGDDVARRFRDRWPARSDVVIAGGRQPVVDLWTANCLQIAEAGVPPENIQSSQTCTSCRVDQFFSHRRQNGPAGRFAAVIALP